MRGPEKVFQGIVLAPFFVLPDLFSLSSKNAGPVAPGADWRESAGFGI
jgi:hypothetical protein